MLCADAQVATLRADEAQRAAALASAAEAAGESFLAGLARTNALRAAAVAESARGTWDACTKCNNAGGRGARVIAANYSSSGRTVCCNVLDRNGVMQCTTSTSLRLVLVPVVILAVAVCIALLRVSRRAEARPLPCVIWGGGLGVRGGACCMPALPVASAGAVLAPVCRLPTPLRHAPAARPATPPHGIGRPPAPTV